MHKEKNTGSGLKRKSESKNQWFEKKESKQESAIKDTDLKCLK